MDILKGNQSQFAKWYGCSNAAVTYYKKNDQLVFTPEGLIDFVASKKRIDDTADPNRDDVKKRHAANRGEEVEDEPSNPTFQDSRALKEQYLALQAKADYEKSIGSLVERTEVDRDFVKIAAIIRSAFERLPDFLSAELAAEQDPNRIRAMLSEEIEAALNQGAKQIEGIK